MHVLVILAPSSFAQVLYQSQHGGLNRHFIREFSQLLYLVGGRGFLFSFREPVVSRGRVQGEWVDVGVTEGKVVDRFGQGGASARRRGEWGRGLPAGI
jgi:hypothetical protein